MRRTTLALPALSIALLLAACATAPKPAPTVAARGPFIADATADASICRPGYLVVHNGEEFPIELLGRAATGGQWGAMGSRGVQKLGPLAAGHTDTLVDLRTELRYVEALPDESHAVYASTTYATNGPPMNRPKHVTFACAAAGE